MAVKFAKRAAETTHNAVEELKTVMEGEGIEMGLEKLSIVNGEGEKQRDADEKRLMKGKERNEAIREAGEKYLSKRWELLALCQQAIGDKKASLSSLDSETARLTPLSLAARPRRLRLFHRRPLSHLLRHSLHLLFIHPTLHHPHPPVSSKRLQADSTGHPSSDIRAPPPRLRGLSATVARGSGSRSDGQSAVLGDADREFGDVAR
jgi:hypothetical protein